MLYRRGLLGGTVGLLAWPFAKALVFLFIFFPYAEKMSPENVFRTS